MSLALVVDFSRILNGEGIAIAATGMVIVFTALLLITLFISALPHILEVVGKVLPEVSDRHAPQDHPESLLPDEAVLAALGFVLHTELQRQVETVPGKTS